MARTCENISGCTARFKPHMRRNVPVATMNETLNWAHMRETRRASVGSGQVATGTPSTRHNIVVIEKPNAWNSGSEPRNTSSAVGKRTLSHCLMLPIKFRCVSSTPFGRPSEPELKIIVATSSRLTFLKNLSSRYQAGKIITRKKFFTSVDLWSCPFRSSI